MSCCGGQFDDRFDDDAKKPWKAQNNAGCSCNGTDRNRCDTPSLAAPKSPLARWEAIHGKLITKILVSQDENGHKIVTIQKLTCPIITAEKSKNGCCSLRYKVLR